MVQISIFDYGAGNIFSLQSSLQRNGAQVSIINDFEGSSEVDGMVLPGVGNFDPAIISINKCKTGFSRIYGKKYSSLGNMFGNGDVI